MSLRRLLVPPSHSELSLLKPLCDHRSGRYLEPFTGSALYRILRSSLVVPSLPHTCPPSVRTLGHAIKSLHHLFTGTAIHGNDPRLLSSKESACIDWPSPSLTFSFILSFFPRALTSGGGVKSEVAGEDRGTVGHLPPRQSPELP